MYHSFFIYSSVDGHLGSFHVLAIVNSMNEYWDTWVFFSFGFLISSGMAGSYGGFIPSF